MTSKHFRRSSGNSREGTAPFTTVSAVLLWLRLNLRNTLPPELVVGARVECALDSPEWSRSRSPTTDWRPSECVEAVP